ncbi:MAG: hypothetical protein DRJ65_05610 [Acidobacteria bacterium]|nr:MAG: hypothetical protein DRJ65_05610 [Acidobacteriota bacterium]
MDDVFQRILNEVLSLQVYVHVAWVWVVFRVTLIVGCRRIFFPDRPAFHRPGSRFPFFYAFDVPTFNGQTHSRQFHDRSAVAFWAANSVNALLTAYVMLPWITGVAHAISVFFDV